MNKQIKYLTLGMLVAVLTFNATALDLLELGAKALESGVRNKDAFSDIDEPKEVDLGKNMSAQLLGAAPLVNDPALQKYVNQVGMWLVAQSERPNLPWRFGVLNEDTINAFAAPGGYIFISKGLFLLFRNESELAGVLAHEIGHVLVKHHLEDIQERARNTFMKDLGGAVIEDSVGGGWGNMVKQLANAGVDVWESGLNRDDELEADQVGVVLAARAGYDPYGLLGVLDTMSRLNPKSESFKQMHATHPTAKDRINNLDSKMTGKLDNYVSNPINSARLYQLQNQLDKKG